MKAYSFFSKVYDAFMSDIPYVDWVDMIEEYFEKNGISSDNVLELGCGTGRFSRLLAADGYDVTGIDLSENMIKIARKNKMRFDIDYSVQDMRDFSLNKDFGIVLSVCDSMNYLLTTDDLYNTFLSVKKHLKRDGVFLFDMKTEHFYEELGDNIFSDEREFGLYYWENEYDKETRDNEYYLNFFIKKGKSYKRYEEEHTQHAFTKEEVVETATKAGFRLKELLGEFNDDRVYYIFELGE